MGFRHKVITQEEPQHAASVPGLKRRSHGIGEALRPLFSLVGSLVEHSYGPVTEPDPEDTDKFPVFMEKGRHQKPRLSCRVIQLQLTADSTQTGLCFKRELKGSLREMCKDGVGFRYSMIQRLNGTRSRLLVLLTLGWVSFQATVKEQNHANLKI